MTGILGAMYAIHVEVHTHQLEYVRVDLATLSEVIPRVSDCRVEHVRAPNRPHPLCIGVVFVSAASISAAGSGVLEAVRTVLKDVSGRAHAEFSLPGSGRQRGLCHGVVSVRPGPSER